MSIPSCAMMNNLLIDIMQTQLRRSVMDLKESCRFFGVYSAQGELLKILRF